MSDLNKPQKILMILMYILGGLSLLVGSFVIYNLVNFAKPQTLGVTYASTLNSSSGKEPICTVNIWSNENNNGQQMYEILWNSYTDADGQGIKGFGMQVVGDYVVINAADIYGDRDEDYWEKLGKATEFKNGFSKEGTLAYGDWYFYNTDDLGESSYMLPFDKIGNNLYISIEDKFYQIRLTNYTYNVDKTVWLFWNKREEHSASQTFFELTDFVFHSALQDSARHENSTYYINFLECSAFYEILYKDEKGQYHEMPDTTDLKNYLQVKVNYHKDGITSATDSMFKQIGYSTTWSFFNNDNLKKYWNAYGEIKITEKQINSIYNKERNSYYVTIDEKFAKYLENANMAEIIVDINLDNLNYDIYGIDLKFFTFDMKQFEITSTKNTAETFVLYNSGNTNIAPTLHLGGAA